MTLIAHIKHKLEILVDIDQPVAEINNVISAFLRLHAGQEQRILFELQKNITEALTRYEKPKGDATHGDDVSRDS